LENKKPDAKGTCFEIPPDEVRRNSRREAGSRFTTKIQIEKRYLYLLSQFR